MPVDWEDRKRCKWCCKFIGRDEDPVRDGKGWWHDACEEEALDFSEGLITSDQLKLKMKRSKEVKNVRKRRTVARKVRKRSRV